MSETEMQSRLAEYHAKPSVGRASELFSAAIVGSKTSEQVAEIARKILGVEINSPVLREVAEVLASGDFPNLAERRSSLKSTSSISNLREFLTFEPRNAVRWSDLAREYLAMGLWSKANRAMKVALHLAPDHYYILRANSTLLWQQDQLDKAIDTLNMHPKILEDPRLAAPLVALSDLSGAKLPGSRHFLKIIDDENYSRLQRSELAAAFGTLELSEGSAKRGIKLLRRSLDTPTENVLAQAMWLNAERKVSLIEELPTNIAHLNEARSRQHATRFEWHESLKSTEKWFEDEPYSTPAAIFGTWTASEACEWRRGVEFAKRGLKISPNSATLLNNIAYHSIQLGDFLEARHHLELASKVDADATEERVLDATEGLLAFRIGEHAKGRYLYQNSIDYFVAKKNWDRALEASVRLAIEEERIGSEFQQESRDQVQNLSSKSNDPNVLRHLNLLSW